MAGRDLPGPNSLDRKTKFQRNFNQLWWESEREREGRGRRARDVGGGGGREVVLPMGCVEQRPCEEEPWAATASWAGDLGDWVSVLPRGGRCLIAVVADAADAGEAALGSLRPAEPSWHRCCASVLAPPSVPRWRVCTRC